MIREVEGLKYRGLDVTATVEFLSPFDDTYIIDAVYTETGIPLEELECEYLRSVNRTRLKAMGSELLEGGVI